MGRPKHELPVGDTTLLSWQIARLRSSFGDLIVVGAPAPDGARSAADRHVGAGPVAGIEAGLLALKGHDRAFVLACDMPRASASLGALLIERSAGHDAAVPVVERRPQPTAAAYARSAAAKLGAFLDSGRRRASDALDALDVLYIGEDELLRDGYPATEFADLDTPTDYEAFRAELRT